MAPVSNSSSVELFMTSSFSTIWIQLEFLRPKPCRNALNINSDILKYSGVQKLQLFRIEMVASSKKAYQLNTLRTLHKLLIANFMWNESKSKCTGKNDAPEKMLKSLIQNKSDLYKRIFTLMNVYVYYVPYNISQKSSTNYGLCEQPQVLLLFLS